MEPHTCKSLDSINPEKWSSELVGTYDYDIKPVIKHSQFVRICQLSSSGGRKALAVLDTTWSPLMGPIVTAWRPASALVHRHITQDLHAFNLERTHCKMATLEIACRDALVTLTAW